ncbi:hypothetical protein BJ170DRAFT_597557 [Xylariales sp. AK1849]|nr:hypothetical protein BJ170DRAFT_597557 [Xylariales sp. AK1849]
MTTELNLSGVNWNQELQNEVARGLSFENSTSRELNRVSIGLQLKCEICGTTLIFSEEKSNSAFTYTLAALWACISRRQVQYYDPMGTIHARRVHGRCFLTTCISSDVVGETKGVESEQSSSVVKKRASSAASLPSSLSDFRKKSKRNLLVFLSSRKVVEERTLAPLKVANLDFEARVPVPFSIFPSSYKEAEVETTTQTHEELEIKLPEKAGREGQHSSFSKTSVNLPPRGEHHFSEEEVRFTREEERYRRPGVHREYYEERSWVCRPGDLYAYKAAEPQTFRPAPTPAYSETHVEVDHHHRPQYSAVDQIEREYRSRYQPSYKEDVHVTETTIDPPHSRPFYDEKVRVTETTIDEHKPTPSYHKETRFTEETVEYPRHNPTTQKSRMGYYDESGHHHSFRNGLHKMADKVFHHHDDHVEYREVRETRGPRSSSEPTGIPNTVTIPCHHIRMGDILMLQGRPCQVIRISTSAATGQHRYLGVDLFTKQLHEESSYVSNPAPSVVVQTMLGPVFKQYRVLDIQDGSVVAMTETGDVKTGVPVTDQSGLYSRLNKAFESGRGSVRVLVLNDGGRELVVDVKTIHGSRL